MINDFRFDNCYCAKARRNAQKYTSRALNVKYSHTLYRNVSFYGSTIKTEIGYFISVVWKFDVLE